MILVGVPTRHTALGRSQGFQEKVIRDKLAGQKRTHERSAQGKKKGQEAIEARLRLIKEKELAVGDIITNGKHQACIKEITKMGILVVELLPRMLETTWTPDFAVKC